MRTEDLTKEKIGGKAWHLHAMKKAGMNVPHFRVIPSPVFSEPEQLEALINEIASEFNETPWLAVRSSATEEDGSDHSFAGLFTTELFVRPSELREAIAKVRASASSERIRVYLKEKGMATNTGMAVIIQRMINADTAGVAFSIDPVSGEERVVINSVFGVGEGLVSGALNADTFYFRAGEINHQLTTKKQAYRMHSEGGVHVEDLPEHLHNVASLSDDQVIAIAEKVKALEEHFGAPQDVEWAIEADELYLLQARPITTVQKRDPSTKIVWDNSNIIESYPGLSSPLTYSFISKMYAAVYREMSLIMGVSKKENEANAEVFENMLGLLKGRVYYNLVSWYKALALLPGYDLNAEFMERMMGVKERFELPNRVQRSKWTEYGRIIRLIRTMVRNYRQLPRERKTFQEHFNATMEHYNALDLDGMTLTELKSSYLAFEENLTKRWQAPLVNDFFAMIYFGVTQKLSDKYELPSGIHNDLLSGSNDIISTLNVTESMKIVRQIHEEEALRKCFLEEPPERVWTTLSDYPKVKEMIDQFLLRYGDRTVGELKLETITLKQAPEKYIRILQNYLRSDVDPTEAMVHGEELREKAELTLKKALSGKPLKQRIYRYFLTRARTLVSERENLRFERTRGFGKVRELFLSMGEKLVNQGTINHQRDIFYLEMEEVFALIDGHLHEVKTRIIKRKEAYDEFERLRLPERIVTYGPLEENQLDAPPPVIPADGDLQGIGCCPGIIKAQVQVIHDPSEVESLNGDILVTSSTDPGWITLFPGASAILVERGSLLSHSAIVSREMGKPCIVAVDRLLDTLKTGDWVEMDGSTGVIKRLKQ